MEMLAKGVFIIMVLAVVFTDKIPTAKKQSPLPLIAFIVVVLAIGYIGQATGGIV